MEKYVIKPDFNSYDSDLAAERRRADLSVEGVTLRKERADVGSWEKLTIESEEGERSIGRPIGIYDTLTLPRICELDPDEIEDAANEIAKELCRICDKDGISPERILVVGIGNRDLTPDAVGPRAAELVKPTQHIKREDEHIFYSLECSEIAVISPGVTASSGFEAPEIVRTIAEKMRPDVIIAIDALAAGSPARLGKTIQICDTGIHPGSGIGNSRGEISRRTTGAPVIAIGVPTVINSKMFIVENGEARATDKSESSFLCPHSIGDTVKIAASIISGGINQAFGLTF